MSKRVDCDAVSVGKASRATHEASRFVAPWFKRVTMSAASALAMMITPALASAAPPPFSKLAELVNTEDPIADTGSIAASGNTVVVNVVSETESRFHIYTGAGTSWTEQALLLRPVVEDAAGLGASIALDGDTLVIGNTSTGHALVYVRTGTSWTQQTTLVASDAQPGDGFGGAVSVKGNTIVVGASMHDTVAADSGAVYLFTRTGTSWTEQAQVLPSDAHLGQLFGTSVALSGQDLAVGSGAEIAFQAGTYVFNNADGSWVETAKLLAFLGRSQPSKSVALEGDTLLVGGADGVDAFTRSGGSWSLQSLLSSASGPDPRGFHVALAAGAPTVRDQNGIIYFFDKNGATFTQSQTVFTSQGDGSSLAADGNTVVVHDGDFSSSHKAFVYQRGFAPTNINLSASAIAENKPVGSVIGTLTTTDPDINDSFTYSLVSGTGGTDNALFQINGKQLLSAAMFNFENKASYSIRVRSTDFFGFSVEKVLTISVTNVAETNHAPVCSAATATPSTLVMSSDLALTQIAIGNVTDADRDNLSIKITGIRQDEVTRANTSDPSPDGKGVGSSVLQVRNQAVATGNGRVYTVTFDVTDVNKATTCCTIRVGVKPKSTSATPVNNGTLYDSTK